MGSLSFDAFLRDVAEVEARGVLLARAFLLSSAVLSVALFILLTEVNFGQIEGIPVDERWLRLDLGAAYGAISFFAWAYRDWRFSFSLGWMTLGVYWFARSEAVPFAVWLGVAVFSSLVCLALRPRAILRASFWGGSALVVFFSEFPLRAGRNPFKNSSIFAAIFSQDSST